MEFYPNILIFVLALALTAVSYCYVKFPRFHSPTYVQNNNTSLGLNAATLHDLARFLQSFSWGRYNQDDPTPNVREALAHVLSICVGLSPETLYHLGVSRPGLAPSQGWDAEPFPQHIPHPRSPLQRLTNAPHAALENRPDPAYIFIHSLPSRTTQDKLQNLKHWAKGPASHSLLQGARPEISGSSYVIQPNSRAEAEQVVNFYQRKAPFHWYRENYRQPPQHPEFFVTLEGTTTSILQISGIHGRHAYSLWAIIETKYPEIAKLVPDETREVFKTQDYWHHDIRSPSSNQVLAIPIWHSQQYAQAVVYDALPSGRFSQEPTTRTKPSPPVEVFVLSLKNSR